MWGSFIFDCTYASIHHDPSLVLFPLVVIAVTRMIVLTGSRPCVVLFTTVFIHDMNNDQLTLMNFMALNYGEVNSHSGEPAIALPRWQWLRLYM